MLNMVSFYAFSLFLYSSFFLYVNISLLDSLSLFGHSVCIAGEDIFIWTLLLKGFLPL